MKLTESYLRNLIKQAINEINSDYMPGLSGTGLPSRGTYTPATSPASPPGNSPRGRKTSLDDRREIAYLLEVYPELLSDYEELMYKDISDEKILFLLRKEIAEPDKDTRDEKYLQIRAMRNHDFMKELDQLDREELRNKNR